MQNFIILIKLLGNSRDYDNWAVNGCEGWNWDAVFPYFLKTENNKNSFYKHSGLLFIVQHNKYGYIIKPFQPYIICISKIYI